MPTELSSLRRLRILHMGGNLEREDAEEEDGEMLEAALRTLRNLKVRRAGGRGRSELEFGATLSWRAGPR